MKIRSDHRFTFTFRYQRAKDRALRLLNLASVNAGIGQYHAPRVHNAELFAQDGRPWHEVQYDLFPRIHQCERRVAKIGKMWLHAPVMA